MQKLQQTIFKNQVNHIVERNQTTLDIYNIGQADPQKVNKILNILRKPVLPNTHKQQIINAFTEPTELLKWSVMPYFQKIINEISIQYLDLALKVNPLTMQEYKLPNGQQIASFFKTIINLKTTERMQKILDMLSGDEDLYKLYMTQILGQLIKKARQIIEGMNFCISDFSVFSILLRQNQWDVSALNSRQLTQYNEKIIKRKLQLIGSVYPLIKLDITKIRIQHILLHNAKFAQSMLAEPKKQHLFSEMLPSQNFNPSRGVLIKYLENLDLVKYKNLVRQQQQEFYEMQQEMMQIPHYGKI